jgi:5'-AMP-activated protein kinase regulatory gamma subunit
VHRLVVVDDEDRVIGIISLSDLLVHLVLRPGDNCEQQELQSLVHATDSDTIPEEEAGVEAEEEEEEEEEEEDEEDDEGSPVPVPQPPSPVAEEVAEEAMPVASMAAPAAADNTSWREVTVSGGE